MSQTLSYRNIYFDLIRFVAIFLVIFRHASLNCIISDIGWIGVDLFFVLSGFLVSGILFREIKLNGSANLGRFLIRRALKIYPMFYLFLFVSVIFRFFFATHFLTVPQILSELFFIQSYSQGIWDHTWSLAVEEHFYLILALLVLLYQKLEFARRNFIFLSFICISLPILFRAVTISNSNDIQYLFQSHLRMDALFIGMLLSFLNTFSVMVNMFVKQNSTSIAIFGIILSGIVFFYPAGGCEMNTWAGSIMTIGFGLIVISASLTRERESNKVRYMEILAGIGKYSYGIYLWHLFVKGACMHLLPNNWQWVYIIMSFPVGIAISILIEKPILEWRNRVYNETYTPN